MRSKSDLNVVITSTNRINIFRFYKNSGDEILLSDITDVNFIITFSFGCKMAPSKGMQVEIQRKCEVAKQWWRAPYSHTRSAPELRGASAFADRSLYCVLTGPFSGAAS